MEFIDKNAPSIEIASTVKYWTFGIFAECIVESRHRCKICILVEIECIPMEIEWTWVILWIWAKNMNFDKRMLQIDTKIPKHTEIIQHRINI